MTKSTTATDTAAQALGVARAAARHQAAVAEATVPMFAGSAAMIAERRALAKAKTEAEKRIKEIDRLMVEHLQAAGVTVGTWHGQAVVELQHRTRQDVDVTRLRADRPDVAAEFAVLREWDQPKYL